MPGKRQNTCEGISKGAEFALAAAIVYPELSCVIVKTHSWYYSEGLKKGQPCGSCYWPYEGKSLPFTPYNHRKINAMKLILKAKEYNILPINLKKHIVEESIIPVERIHAPILIFSAERDTIWPSAESGRKLCGRLEENQFSYPYKHICFKQMSHMMFEYCGEEIRYFMKSEREAPEICKKEREQMGQECVNMDRTGVDK